MRNLFKEIKDNVKKAFHREGPTEKVDTSSTQPDENAIVNKGPINPGLEEKKEEDVGKKVFEKTGQLREGVGQSSTLNPQERPVKTNQGIKQHRKNYKKTKSRGPKDSMKNK